MMTVTDKIIEKVRDLPEAVQAEVLDFVEYLKDKLDANERNEWGRASLSFAMRDMESEVNPYSEQDIKESFA